MPSIDRALAGLRVALRDDPAGAKVWEAEILARIHHGRSFRGMEDAVRFILAECLTMGGPGESLVDDATLMPTWRDKEPLL